MKKEEECKKVQRNKGLRVRCPCMGCRRRCTPVRCACRSTASSRARGPVIGVNYLAVTDSLSLSGTVRDRSCSSPRFCQLSRERVICRLALWLSRPVSETHSLTACGLLLFV
jgi:hypothetical protein